MTDNITLPRAVVEQVLEFCESVHGGCTDSDDGTVEAITVWCPEIIEALRTALAEPVQEPVAAQHRFRNPQRGRHEWSIWQPCEVRNRPAREIDSQGYQVEYRLLYTTPPDHTAKIERAVAAEREACALVCETEAEKWEGDDGPVSAEARLCAIAICARGKA